MSNNQKSSTRLDEENDFTEEQNKKILELYKAGKDDEARAYIKECVKKNDEKMDTR